MHAMPIDTAVTIVINESSASLRSGRESMDLTSAPVWRCGTRNGTRACGVRIDHLHLDARMALHAGDLIVRVNGLPVSTPDALLAAVRTFARSGKASLDVARNGQLLVLQQTQIEPLVRVVQDQPRPPVPPTLPAALPQPPAPAVPASGMR